jgi:hypothetical protein
MNYEKKLKDLDSAFKNRDAGKEVFSENSSEKDIEDSSVDGRKVFKLRKSGEGLKNEFKFSQKARAVDTKNKTKCRFLTQFTC